ncbi:unnamed protein product [Rhizoctonia solani]|uniref:Uncharacterized protein n=1 Tax=Rhizoctonia solani TaxID=456999 RepID=A0A8H3E638_9AGAM|nr:unnamed protein product [Rhizoctonia solani]
MSPPRMTRTGSRSFTSTVVDLIVKPNTVIKGNKLPSIVELYNYLRSLDCVVLAYHHKREKETAKFDHIYIVFRTSVDAANFLRMWLFWDDAHFMKVNYQIQQSPDFPTSAVLHLLQYEVEDILDKSGSSGAKEPARFIGYAFIYTTLAELQRSNSPGSLEKQCQFLEETFANQEIHLIHLERMVKEARDDRDKRIKKNQELRAELATYEEELRRRSLTPGSCGHDKE